MTADVLSVVAAMPSVSLQEVNDTAALQTRVDRKYALRRDAASALLTRLPMGMRVVDIEGSRESRYSSVYFDTPEFTSFFLAATSRRRRFKIRTRHYVDTDDAFLEAKTRGGRDTTVKDRIPYDVSQRARITPEGRIFSIDALRSIGSAQPEQVVDALKPVLTTDYRRVTLLHPESASRATIDTSTTWSLADGRTITVPDLVIIETKSGLSPSAIDRLLWSCGHRPAPISKFATGLAALRPDLPHNKWTRVLRRHFPTATSLAP